MKHKIVTIGGGSGQPEVLSGLKHHDVDITAVVTMMDNGGSSGKLRDEQGVLPPGDVRKCLVALAEQSDPLGEKWHKRDEEGHAAGNLEILERVKEVGWETAMEQFAHEHHLRGRVLPVTLDPAHLVATLENGQEVHGEEAIDVPEHDTSLRIRELRLDRPATALPAVLEAIREADCIVLTVGDIFTSVVPNLLVDGVTDAIAGSDAHVVYVCNRSSKEGEATGFSSHDYVEEIQKYLKPATLTHVIVDDGTVTCPDDDLCVVHTPMPGVQTITADLGDPNNPLIVSGEKAARAIMSVCTSSSI